MSSHAAESTSILETASTVTITQAGTSFSATLGRPIARVLPSVQTESPVLTAPMTLTPQPSLTMHMSLDNPASITMPSSLTTPSCVTTPISMTMAASLTPPISRPVSLTSPTPRGRIITCIVASVGGTDTSTVTAVTQSRPCIIQLASTVQHVGAASSPILSVAPAPPGPIAALHVFDGQALGLRPVDQATKVKVKSALSGSFPLTTESVIRWPSKSVSGNETSARQVDSSTSTSPQSSPPRVLSSAFSRHALGLPYSASGPLLSLPSSDASSPSSVSSFSSTSSSGSSRSRTRTGNSSNSRKSYPGDVSEAEVSRMRLPGAVCRTVNVRMRRHYQRRLARMGMEGVNFRHVQRSNESFCVRTGDRQFYRGLPLGVRHPVVLYPTPFCPDREKHMKGVRESMLELPLACPTCWSVQRNYPPFPHPAPRPRSRSRVRSSTPPRAPLPHPSPSRPQSHLSKASPQLSTPPTSPLSSIVHSLPQASLPSSPLHPSPKDHRRLALGV